MLDAIAVATAEGLARDARRVETGEQGLRRGDVAARERERMLAGRDVEPDAQLEPAVDGVDRAAAESEELACERVCAPTRSTRQEPFPGSCLRRLIAEK